MKLVIKDAIKPNRSPHLTKVYMLWYASAMKEIASVWDHWEEGQT
jgi:hypothetical protein